MSQISPHKRARLSLDEGRHVKRRHTSEEDRIPPAANGNKLARPPWHHEDDLRYYTAETRPDFTPLSIVNFLKENAVSVDYQRKGTRKSRLIARYPDGRSVGLPTVYRLPLCYFLHFMWASVWLVLVRKLPWADHMFDILHIARILRVLMDEALDAAPADKAASSSGDAVPTLPREWRCATFDRAAIRMFYAGFLLPRDGYGDTYMADFWEAHEDLRYKQDISECNWAQFVARWHDGFAPLSKEQHKAFDAASYADCLQWSGDDSDGHPVWDPSAAGEEGYVVTDALYAQSGIPRDTPSTRIVQPSEAPRDVSKTADPPSGEDADLGAGLPPPQLDHAAPAQRPPASGPSGEVDPEAPDSAVATPRTAATSGPESSQTTSTDEIQSNEPEPMRIDEDPAPARPLSGRDGAPTTTNRHVSQPQSTPGAASSRLVSLPQKARPARPPPPIAQSPAPQSGPSSTARIAEQPPIASPLQSPTTAPHRWSSSSRHTPATVAHSDETAHLRLENARLQAELAAQSEYRTLLTAALERERSAAAADRQAALMREAQAAQRELRASEELAQMRAEAARREDDAREREAWWRAASAKWDAERAEYKADVERREEQLARRDRELDEAAAAQAGLRQQFALLQTGMGAGRMIGGPVSHAG